MALDNKAIARLYQERAARCDFSANAYYLLGIREFAYRKMAVAALNLKPEDTVVEIGCGTGLNFSLLRRSVGPAGRIVGVDLPPETLEEADRRVRRSGWSNVELVQSDAAAYRFPEALGVGLGLGVLDRSLFGVAVWIGIVAGAMTWLAMKLGNKLSQRFARRMKILGGLILIAIAFQATARLIIAIWLM